MKGEIWIESKVGIGSVFNVVVTFPVASTTSDLPATPKSMSGVRALVVDDNESSRQVLQEQLEWNGISCDVLGSAAECDRSPDADRGSSEV